MRKIFTFFAALCCAVMVNAGSAGALSGKFSVSATRQVVFSQGNLQHQASTDTWQFAANQWTSLLTNNVNGAGTELSDVIDLFGWGTGNAPTTVSENNDDYASFNDWGANAISNGGDAADLWRTLSLDEWNYLFRTRANADSLFGLGTVRGVKGLILLPDNWNLPDGLTFLAGKHYLSDQGTWWRNTNGDNFEKNTYSDETDWKKMESAGAVFFPVTGQRTGTSVGNALLYFGMYWSSTDGNAGYARYMQFSGIEMNPANSYNHYEGRAVRLVQNVPHKGDTIIVNGLKYRITQYSGSNAQVALTKQKYTNSSLVVTRDSIEYCGIKFEMNGIDAFAFKGNTSLTSVTIACNYIYGGAFQDCPNLATMTLQDGVKQLAYGNLKGNAVETIHIPASVINLDNYYSSLGSAFLQNNLKSVTIEGTNPSYKVGEDGAVYSKDGIFFLGFPYQYEKPLSEIPEGVENVAFAAFKGCANLTDTFTLPTTLVNAQDLFRDNAKVKCIIINSDNNRILNCFQGNSIIEEVILGKNCHTVGQLMFWNCNNINKITVYSPTMPILYDPSHASFYPTTEVNAKLYVHCGQSDTYKADENKWAKFTNIIDTLLYNIDVTAANAKVVLSDTTDCNKVTITVTPNPGYAFVNWDNGVTTASFDCTVTSDTAITANIKKILAVGETFRSNTIEGVPVLYKVLTNAAGDKTVQVGEYASPSWNRPNAIAKATAGEVTIPDSAVYFDEKFEVVKIDQYAFWTCNSVTALHLPNTITKIEGLGVNELKGLTELNIPNKLENTGLYNFAYMSLLESITLPSSVKYLEYGTFAFNPKLAEIVGWNPSQFERVGVMNWSSSSPIWSNVSYIQNEDGYWYMGDILILLPNSTTIEVKDGTRIAVSGGNSTAACKNISFPSTIEAMSSGVLYDCAILETCTIKALTPPLVYDAHDVMKELDANGLRQTANGTWPPYGNNPTPETVKYYVPKAAVATYKADDKWNMLDIRPIGGWTVAFVDHNGDTIASEQVEQGNRPASIPTSVPTYYDTHMHVFDNAWDTTLVGIGDTLYSAKYTTEDLPKFYVHFYKTEADALAQTSRITRVQKTYGESAVAAAAQVAEEKIEAVPCEQITGWDGGDLTSVKADLHVWPVWGVGKYKVTFFDPIADANIAVRENIECSDLVEAPVAPEHAGYTFKGWDSDAWKDTDALTADLLIKAVYDTATGLDEINSSNTQTVKLLKQGNLYILRNGEMYNAQGARVE